MHVCYIKALHAATTSLAQYANIYSSSDAELQPLKTDMINARKSILTADATPAGGARRVLLTALHDDACRVSCVFHATDKCDVLSNHCCHADHDQAETYLRAYVGYW